MIKVSLISLLLAISLIPFVSHASEQSLLPAICQQVVSPDPKTSVSKVIIDHFVERAKEVPNEMVRDVEAAGDKFALAVSETLESKKSSPSNISSANAAAGVLGAHTQIGWFDRVYDAALSILQVLVKHWVWTMAGAGTLLGYFLLRF